MKLYTHQGRTYGLDDDGTLKVSHRRGTIDTGDMATVDLAAGEQVPAAVLDALGIDHRTYSAPCEVVTDGSFQVSWCDTEVVTGIDGDYETTITGHAQVSVVATSPGHARAILERVPEVERVTGEVIALDAALCV